MYKGNVLEYTQSPCFSQVKTCAVKADMCTKPFKL